jgi:hypothetical protein
MLVWLFYICVAGISKVLETKYGFTSQMYFDVCDSFMTLSESCTVHTTCTYIYTTTQHHTAEGSHLLQAGLCHAKFFVRS